MKEVVLAIAAMSPHKKILWPALTLVGSLLLVWLAPLQTLILSIADPPLLWRSIIALLILVASLLAYFSILVYRLANEIISLESKLELTVNGKNNLVQNNRLVNRARKPDFTGVYRR